MTEHIHKYQLEVTQGVVFILVLLFDFCLKAMSKKFLNEPQSTTAWVGSIARFSCQIRHAVPPATITWKKDGSPLSPTDRIVILDQGVLQINNVNKADEGNYRCVAENVAKTRESKVASLTVQAG